MKILHNTAKCAEQQSNTIQLNQGQPRVVETSQNISHKTQVDREVLLRETQENNQQETTNVPEEMAHETQLGMPRRLSHQPWKHNHNNHTSSLRKKRRWLPPPIGQQTTKEPNRKHVLSPRNMHWQQWSTSPPKTTTQTDYCMSMQGPSLMRKLENSWSIGILSSIQSTRSLKPYGNEIGRLAQGMLGESSAQIQ